MVKWSPDFRGRLSVAFLPSFMARAARDFPRIFAFFDLEPEKIARFLASVRISRHRFLADFQKFPRTVS
jgi:hypothetical protein